MRKMLSVDNKKDWLDTLGQEQKKLELQCKDLEQTTRTLPQRIEDLNFVVEWYANKDADVEEEAKKELKTTNPVLNILNILNY